MMDFEDFGNPLAGKPLSQADKAAAVLLAMGRGVAGRLLKYFTQAELQAIIQSAQTLRTIPPNELLDRINAARRARSAGALELDENLQAASMQAARDFFARPDMTQQQAVDQASAAVRRFAIQFRRIGGVMAIVTTLEEAATLEPTFDSDLRFVGIGVAQGDRPDQPPGSIA